MKLRSSYYFFLKCLITYIIFIINAYSNCDYQLASPTIYQTTSNLNTNASYDLTISRPKKSNYNQCAYFYYFFSKGNSTNYNRKAVNGRGEGLSYNLYKYSNQSGVLKDLIDISNSNDYLTGYLQNADTPVLSNFYFYLPSTGTSSMVRGGVYTDNILLNVYSLGVNSPWGYYEFTRNIPIVINVPKEVNLSLVDSGGPFDINSTNKVLNFGTLETSEQVNFDLRVASNAGFKVSLSSLNNGKLKSLQNAPQIDYSLYVSGNMINLSNSASNPVLIATGSGVTGSQGSVFPMKVKIGTINDSHFGDYEDYITVTAVTND
jgi:hypothetical protein